MCSRIVREHHVARFPHERAHRIRRLCLIHDRNSSPHDRRYHGRGPERHAGDRSGSARGRDDSAFLLSPQTEAGRQLPDVPRRSRKDAETPDRLQYAGGQRHGRCGPPRPSSTMPISRCWNSFWPIIRSIVRSAIKAGSATCKIFHINTRPTTSRFAETKRIFQKEYFSPLIETQMNRCVQCLRCVRYCDEVMDVKALAPVGRGTMTEIKHFGAHQLDCEFCGGCVQICPVGAITSRLSMYEYRPWMLKRADTICTFCGDGCRITVQTKGNELIEVNSAVWGGPEQRRSLRARLFRLSCLHPSRPSHAASDPPQRHIGRGHLGRGAGICCRAGVAPEVSSWPGCVRRAHHVSLHQRRSVCVSEIHAPGDRHQSHRQQRAVWTYQRRAGLATGAGHPPVDHRI